MDARSCLSLHACRGRGNFSPPRLIQLTENLFCLLNSAVLNNRDEGILTEGSRNKPGQNWCCTASSTVLS